MSLTFTGGVVLQQGQLTTAITIPGPPEEIAVNAVHFDASNDYLTLAAPFTGASDSAKGIFAAWFFPQANGSSVFITRMNSAVKGRIDVFRTNLNTMEIKLSNPSNTDLVKWTSTLTNFTTANGWRHILVAWNLTGGTPVFQAYIDDVVEPGVLDTGPDAGLVGWEGVVATNYGSANSAAAKWNGDLAQHYLNTAEYLDLSDEANRRQFISTGGKPVDMGTAGAGPTGTAPSMFLNGATSAWHTNKGIGGGFTENGALTDASSSPSD